MSRRFRIHPMPPALSVDEMNALRECAVAHLADSLGPAQAVGSPLHPRHAPNQGTMCGCAVTVRTAPGDNLMVQKALDMARPGDVVVVDGGGHSTQALVGGIMLSLARVKGIAGFVVDGAVRDLDELARSPVPVYASSVAPRGPTRVGPGEINVVVTVCGIAVSPGDVVVGDTDGVAIVPRKELPQVLEAARALRGKEEAMLHAIRNRTIDRGWIDAALKAGGCEFDSEIDQK